MRSRPNRHKGLQITLAPVHTCPQGDWTWRRGLIDAHLQWCSSRNLRSNSLKAKRQALRRLARGIAPTALEDATYLQLSRWYWAMGGSPQYRASQLSHIRQWYKWLRREGLRADDPTERIDAPRVHNRKPRPIATRDLERAIVLAGEPVRSWLLFGALAGLRACEVAPLHRRNILTESDPPILYVEEGKGGKDRTIPLHPMLFELSMPMSGFLFPRADGIRPITARRVSSQANEHLHGIGLIETFHTLRHWFGTHFYETSEGDLRATQELMGHENPSATAVYTGWSFKRAATAVAALTLDLSSTREPRLTA